MACDGRLLLRGVAEATKHPIIAALVVRAVDDLRHLMQRGAVVKYFGEIGVLLWSVPLAVDLLEVIGEEVALIEWIDAVEELTAHIGVADLSIRCYHLLRSGLSSRRNL